MRFSTLTSAPRLETERLVLRQFREDDLDAQVAILSDPIVVRHFNNAQFSREDCFRRLLAGIGLWMLQGVGILAAERKSDGRMIGHVGLFDYHREMTPSIEGKPELGYMFASEVHGQGLAREANEAILAWADQAVEAEEIVALIAPENTPSLRLAERLGFERLPDGIYRDEATTIWGRKRRT